MEEGLKRDCNKQRKNNGTSLTFRVGYLRGNVRSYTSLHTKTLHRTTTKTDYVVSLYSLWTDSRRSEMSELFCLILMASSFGLQTSAQIIESSTKPLLGDTLAPRKADAIIEATNTGYVIGDTYNVTEQQSCTTASGEEAKCVHRYKCVSPDERKGYIDFRGLADEPCDEINYVCCALTKIFKANPISDAYDATGQVHTTCGYRNPDGVGFKLTAYNNEANFGEFPWMVAIQKYIDLLRLQPAGPNQEELVYVGGGSLIHPSIVLTAAHLVDKDTKLRIRVGEWDTQTEEEVYPHQERDVREIVLHPEYLRKNLFNDIGLLFLTEPVDTSLPHIGLACLPSAGGDGHVAAGTRCLTGFWGKDLFGKEGRYTVILKKVEVPVVEHGDCEKQMRKTRLGPRFTLYSTFMCAGGEVGTDSCQRDGGAPLVCPVENEKHRYVQSGIVAWGLGCGGDGLPVAYVDVASLRRWIDDAVSSRGYDPKMYTI